MSAFLLPIIFLLSGVGLFFGYTSSAYNSITTLKSDAIHLDEALDRAKQLTALRDSLVARYNTIAASDLNRLNKLLPDNIDNIRLIIDINNIAASRNIKISTFDFVNTSSADTQSAAQPAESGVRTPAMPPANEDVSAREMVSKNKEPYGSVQLSFTASAPYEDFLAFLVDLEKSLRVVNIKSIELEAEGADAYHYTVIIETYWLK